METTSGARHYLPTGGGEKAGCYMKNISPGPFEVKVTQSCLTLCDPMDYTVHGILQARILEWVG